MNIKTLAYFDIESALQASPCTHFTRPGTVVICIYHNRVPLLNYWYFRKARPWALTTT
jgi:hypothetical protein